MDAHLGFRYIVELLAVGFIHMWICAFFFFSFRAVCIFDLLGLSTTYCFIHHTTCIYLVFFSTLWLAL